MKGSKPKKAPSKGAAPKGLGPKKGGKIGGGKMPPMPMQPDIGDQGMPQNGPGFKKGGAVYKKKK